MASRRASKLLVRLRQVDERAGIERVDAARRQLEEKERRLAAEIERARRATGRLSQESAAGDGPSATRKAGRLALREQLRAGLRADVAREEARRRRAAQESAVAAREYEASQDALAQAHRARAAAEKALRAAEQADQRLRARRAERALEDRHK